MACPVSPQPTLRGPGAEDAPCVRARPGAMSLLEGELPQKNISALSYLSQMSKNTAYMDRKLQNQGIVSTPLARESSVSRLYVHGIATDFHEDSRWLQRRKQACMLLASDRFDALMGAVILVNSITIGVELSERLQGGPESITLQVIEPFFLVAYMSELSLRFFGMHGACLQDQWVRFDIVVVFSGFISTVVIGPLEGAGAVSGFELLVVLRMARLLRLARVIRLISKFKVLWLLVSGLLNCASTMFYTLSLLVIVLYIFACVGAELIGMHDLARGPTQDDVFSEIVENYFSSVPQTMLTLVQFALSDSVASIYKPLIEADYFLLLYFVGTILVIGIVLMNLITAVIVNQAIDQASNDQCMIEKEEHTRKVALIKNLREMFERLDEDGSGRLSMEELEQITDEDRRTLHGQLTVGDPQEIFLALDVDDDGQLGIDEFCDGIWQVAVSKAPIELMRIEKQVNAIRAQLQEVQHRLRTGCSGGGAYSPLCSGCGVNEEGAVAQSRHLNSLCRSELVPEQERPPWAEELLALQRSSQSSLSEILDRLHHEPEQLQRVIQEAVSQCFVGDRAAPADSVVPMPNLWRSRTYSVDALPAERDTPLLVPAPESVFGAEEFHTLVPVLARCLQPICREQISTLQQHLRDIRRLHQQQGHCDRPASASARAIVPYTAPAEAEAGWHSVCGPNLAEW